MSDLSETPFRLYARDPDPPSDARAAFTCVCECDDLSVGDALRESTARGIEVRGIMYRPVEGEPGEWLVNPWS